MNVIENSESVGNFSKKEEYDKKVGSNPKIVSEQGLEFLNNQSLVTGAIKILNKDLEETGKGWLPSWFYNSKSDIEQAIEVLEKRARALSGNPIEYSLIDPLVQK